MYYVKLLQMYVVYGNCIRYSHITSSYVFYTLYVYIYIFFFCSLYYHFFLFWWIKAVCVKCAASGSLETEDPKIATWAPLHNFVGLYLRN